MTHRTAICLLLLFYCLASRLRAEVAEGHQAAMDAALAEDN